MKFIEKITQAVKTVATVSLILGSVVAALNAFNQYWEQNKTTVK